MQPQAPGEPKGSTLKTVSGSWSPCESFIAAEGCWWVLETTVTFICCTREHPCWRSSYNCCIISWSADKAAANALALADLLSSQDVLFPFLMIAVIQLPLYRVYSLVFTILRMPLILAAKFYQKKEGRLIICTDLLDSGVTLFCLVLVEGGRKSM